MQLFEKLKQLNIRTLDSRVRAAIITMFSIGLTNAVKMGITFISIPLIISYLGVPMYGLMTTVIMIGVWLTTIADGGMSLGLKNALIKQRAQEETATTAISQLTSSTFFPMLFLIIIICLLLSCIIPWLNWHKILNLQINIPNNHLIFFILIILWSTLLIIPFTLPRVIYSAYQKEYLFTPWLILGSLLGISLQLFFIKQDWGFVLAGSALQIGNVGALILGTGWFMYQMKAIRFDFKYIKWSVFRSLLSPSADFFILQLMALAIFQSGVFITNYLLGQKEAAIYALHFQIFAYFQMITTLIISPFWSILAETYHKNERAMFKKILTYLIAFIALLTFSFAGVIGYFGHFLMSILSHHQIAFNPGLFLILAIYHFISITIGILSLTLLSIGDTKSMRTIVIIQGLLTIFFSIVFVKTYGLLGCAISSLVSVSLTILWYSPLRIKYIFNNWIAAH